MGRFAAAAKSLQSCPTLCDPIDGSPPGSPIPGILQARTLEWVAISFSNAWKWKVKGKSLSCVRLLATPWTAAYQAPLSMGLSRQEYWSGVPLPSPINTFNLFQIPMKYVLLLSHFMIRNWDSGKIINLPGVMWMVSEGIYQNSNPRSLIQNWALDLMLYCLQFITELLVLKTELHLISPSLPLVLQMQFSFSSSPWTIK